MSEISTLGERFEILKERRRELSDDLEAAREKLKRLLADESSKKRLKRRINRSALRICDERNI